MFDETLISDLIHASPDVRVQLKRNIGQKFSVARISAATRMFIYAHCHESADKDELQQMFFCCGIMARNYDMYGSPIGKEKAEEYLRRIYNEENSKSDRANIESLLDCEIKENGSFYPRFMRFVERIYKDGGAINAKALYFDLLKWNEKTKDVQKKWAQTIVRKTKEKENEQ